MDMPQRRLSRNRKSATPQRPGPRKPRRTSPSPPKRAEVVEDVTLGPVLEFLRLLWAVDHGLQLASKRMHAELGLTGLQRFIVRIVHRSPQISAGLIAQILHVHPSTLTGAIDRLVRQGFLSRREDPEDRRRALFTTTAKGREIAVLERGTVEAAVERTLAGLEPAEKRVAGRALSVLAVELDRLAK